MSGSGKPSSKVIVISTVVVLALAAGVWGVVSWRGGSDSDALPEDLTVASLDAQFDDPAKMMKTMEEVLDRDDLTDEQRRKVRDNMRDVWQARMDKNVNEWFNAPPDQKKAVMDRHIDQFQAAMEVWQKNGERLRKKWEAHRERRKAEGKDVEDDDNPHGPPGWGSRMQSKQGRQTMTQSRDPDRSARMSMYFGAVMARMNERGIEMPWHRGGRSGDRSGRPGRK
jgi:hypothetical protein